MKWGLLITSFLTMILMASAPQTVGVSDFRTYERHTSDNVLYIGDYSGALQVRFKAKKDPQLIYNTQYELENGGTRTFQTFEYENGTYGFSFIPEAKGELLKSVTINQQNVSSGEIRNKTFSIEGYTLKEFPTIFDINTYQGFQNLESDSRHVEIEDGLRFENNNSFYTTKKISAKELDSITVKSRLENGVRANVTISAFKDGELIKNYERPLYNGLNTYNLENRTSNLLPENSDYSVKIEKFTSKRMDIAKISLTGSTDNPHQIRDPKRSMTADGPLSSAISWLVSLLGL